MEGASTRAPQPRDRSTIQGMFKMEGIDDDSEEEPPKKPPKEKKVDPERARAFFMANHFECLDCRKHYKLSAKRLKLVGSEGLSKTSSEGTNQYNHCPYCQGRHVRRKPLCHCNAEEY